jgi:hypothetical protein
VSIDGVPIKQDPTGSFELPDVSIDKTTAVTVQIEAHNVPLGTIVRLHIFSENGPDQILDSSPLTGTLAQSTATVTVTLPPGFSRAFVRAKWETSQ